MQHRLGRISAVLGALAATVTAVTAVTVVTSTAPVVRAAPPGPDAIVAYLVEGVGNGHGRGMSQWGAYGRAVNAGQTYQQILATYYGGASLGSVPDQRITVRLLAVDDRPTAVISATGQAQWAGAPGRSFGSLVAIETGVQRTYDVWGRADAVCQSTAPSAATGWEYLGQGSAAVGQPAVRFTTPSGDDGNAHTGSVLGVCEPDGSVVHYRGSVYAANGTANENRTVNDVPIELYLRSVVSKEVSASWGNAGNGAGMHSLRAQAVAARSYALSQGRYSYAKTCDSSSCQVYGGASTRTSVGAVPVSNEYTNTNVAIAETALQVLLRNGAVLSAEFSASNGPRTAGGSFPPVDDPWDDVPGNPLHRWVRIVDADALAQKYPSAVPGQIGTENDPVAPYDGIWDNRVRLSSTSTVSAWDFRNAFGFPSPGFTITPLTRELVSTDSFHFIGDSVGVSITESDTSELPALLDGVFTSVRYDAVGGRCTSKTGCIGTNGVAAAGAVPVGTPLVLVELGYNDEDSFAGRIDQVMTMLRNRQVGTVAWVNMSERRTSRGYAAANQALRDARARWGELVVLDWNAASSGAARDRWFTDGVHLSSTGQAEFARWLKSQLLPLATGSMAPRKVVPSVPLRVKVAGAGGVPVSGASAVALNVTAVDPDGWGFLTVWPCGSPMPVASNVNFTVKGAVEPNSVLVPVDGTGEVCVYSYASSHVLVDVAGWFSGGFEPVVPNRIVDTRSGLGGIPGR
jgi:peptidoglycan hydrolase-like amidase